MFVVAVTVTQPSHNLPIQQLPMTCPECEVCECYGVFKNGIRFIGFGYPAR
jgi:hypothetical protein